METMSIEALAEETAAEQAASEQTAVRRLAALAHAVRLRVFRALVIAGPNGMNPGVMQEGLNIPPATLSFHLKELMHAGLVEQERNGRYLIYRAAYLEMNALIGYLTENCCQGGHCAVTDQAKACAC